VPCSIRINIEHCLDLLLAGNQVWNAVMSLMMVTETQKRKLSGLVDMNQLGWQIQQGSAAQTTQNHTSGKPNDVTCAEMMEQQHSTTNFPMLTHSRGEPNSKIECCKRAGRRKLSAIDLQHVAGQVKKRNTHDTKQPQCVN